MVFKSTDISGNFIFATGILRPEIFTVTPSQWQSTYCSTTICAKYKQNLIHTSFQTKVLCSKMLKFCLHFLVVVSFSIYMQLPYARILKAHSHTKSGGSIWASFECQCCFWIAGGLVSYLTMSLFTLQLFKKQHWQSREAQIERPLFECECICACVRLEYRCYCFTSIIHANLP